MIEMLGKKWFDDAHWFNYEGETMLILLFLQTSYLVKDSDPANKY